MKRLLRTLGLCLLIAAPHSAVAGKKADTMKPIEAENVQKDIALSASMSQKFVAGDAVPVKVTVQNRSKSDVHFMSQMTYFLYDLQLLDAKGLPVPLTRFGKRVENARMLGGSSVRVTFAAGKHMEATLNLARIFDLTMAGEYTLRIRRDDLEGINLKIEGMKFQVID